MAKNSISTWLVILGFTATIILSIAVIYMLILKVTGHSPTVGELALGIACLSLTTSLTLIGFIININTKVSKLCGQFEGFEKYALRKEK